MVVLLHVFMCTLISLMFQDIFPFNKLQDNLIFFYHYQTNSLLFSESCDKHSLG